MDYSFDWYMNTMRELEIGWQTAVDQAIAIRETQLASSQRLILTLREKLKEKENIAKQKEFETDVLKKTVEEQNKTLELVTNEREMLLKDKKKLEDTAQEYQRNIEANTLVVEHIKLKHKNLVKQLNKASQDTVKDVKSQLEEVKSNEANLLKRISELEETKIENEQRLCDWNRISDQMYEEISEVKNELDGCKFENEKLKEEIASWKQCCGKLEDEKKTMHTNFKQFVSYLETENKKKNHVLEAIKGIESSIIGSIKSLGTVKPSANELKSVATQTEASYSESDKNNDEIIECLRKKEKQMEDDFKKIELDMHNLVQQNLTLKEVMKAMKVDSDNKQKDQVEEEAKVAKLENSVNLLKNNILNDCQGESIWKALSDMKKEVSELKNKNRLYMKSTHKRNCQM